VLSVAKIDVSVAWHLADVCGVEIRPFATRRSSIKMSRNELQWCNDDEQFGRREFILLQCCAINH
jgi:hypothetical protein